MRRAASVAPMKWVTFTMHAVIDCAVLRAMVGDCWYAYVPVPGWRAGGS
jgi:hypothetical protein